MQRVQARRALIATICAPLNGHVAHSITPRRAVLHRQQSHIAMSITAPVATPPIAQPKAAYRVLGALSASHMVNDIMQSLILAMYPILKGDFHLSFVQIGLITLTFQLTASLLQPLIGLYTDRRPQPYSLPFGMTSTLCGLILLAYASTYGMVLLAAALVGVGSAVFHPESSRIARLASGGQHGLAQSVFQVGGNTGSAIGPLLAAAVIVPFGQSSIAWFGLVVLVAIVLLLQVSRWYSAQHLAAGAGRKRVETVPLYPRKTVLLAIGVLLVLIFSKYFYVAGLGSFYTFYLIDKFGLSVQSAQVYLFVFLFASAIGTLVGGPVGDRIGRKPVIWVSILGVAPFALLLPHVESVLDHGAHDRDRAAHVIRLFGDPGLCAGAHPRQGGNGLGLVFRICIRHGRPGRRSAGLARGSNQH